MDCLINMQLNEATSVCNA